MFQVGDLIGFSSYDVPGFVINVATYGIPFRDLSHVAIVGKWNGRLALYESTMMCPLDCLYHGKPVNGVQVHSIGERIETYNGKVWHYSLNTPLNETEQQRLGKFLGRQLGKRYDALGAFRSAGIGWSWVESMLRPADLTSLFCSEYVAAALKQIGRLKTDHVSRFSPNRLGRELRRQRVVKQRVRVH